VTDLYEPVDDGTANKVRVIRLFAPIVTRFCLLMLEHYFTFNA